MGHKHYGRKIRAKDPRAVQLRVFSCAECGRKIIHSKRFGRTMPGHEKTAYCVWCGKYTKHIQLE